MNQKLFKIMNCVENYSILRSYKRCMLHIKIMEIKLDNKALSSMIYNYFILS